MKKFKLFLKIGMWTALILCMAAIFYFSHQNSDQSAELSEGLLQALLDKYPFLLMTHHLIRKFGHLFEYAALGFLVHATVFVTWEKMHPIKATVFCILYAISDEIHQLFVPGRACRFIDVCIDTVGIITGMIAVYILIYILRKIVNSRRNRKNKKVSAA